MRKSNAVLLETAVVAASGLIFALTANALSPRGLKLTVDYFPSSGVVAPAKVAPTATPSTGAKIPGPLEATTQRLAQHGLQVVTSNEVVELSGDPRLEAGLIMLIDARDETHYKTGHIPGAWQFDQYHSEQYLPELLPKCMNADKVVVYCNGGACEDSEFAAIMLRNAGVAPAKLFVYAGGITEWMGNGLRVETGIRGSGALVIPKK
jgi:rhodanese-related sulfurtransferase